MYVVKNAIRNITRAKGRSVLIFILVLIISVSACVALSIKSSADKTKLDTLANMTVTAQISQNRSAMMGGGMGNREDMESMMSAFMDSALTIEDYELYATASSVQNFYYSSSFGLNATEDGIEAYETSSSSSSGGMKNPFSDMGGGMNKGGGMMNQGDFTVTGFSSHDAMTNFIDGTMTVYEGSMFDTEDNTNSASISLELALLNELEVGDEITLVNPNNENEIISFEISSIFVCESTDSFANDIYISYKSLEEIVAHSKEVEILTTNEMNDMEMSSALNSQVGVSYVLATPDMLEVFQEEVIGLGLDSEIYTVSSADVSQFEQVMLPLDNLGNFTLVFFFVVLAIGAVILVVFNLFTMRERKYEIGVLAAIGMQKAKVATQFLLETVMLTFMAVAIGAVMGSVVAIPLGDVLMESQVAQVESTNTQVSNNFGGNFGGMQMGGNRGDMKVPFGAQDIDYADSITMSFDFVVVFQLMAVGLFLALMASSIAIISILRYEPLKILSERG